MLPFETLTVLYFGAIALAAAAAPAPPRLRVRGALMAGIVALGALAASQLDAIDLRSWSGHAYLVAGYWIPALLATPRTPNARFEAWLVRTDGRSRRFSIELPRWAASVLELAYLLCYALVPVSFMLVWMNGTADAVDRFWTAVLLSGFLCYGSLPWLVSRPPRLLAPPAPATAGIHALNEFVLGRLSHGLNTFPSGHVAVSLAAALEASLVAPIAGTVLTVTAILIAAGAVVGRYHYVVDVVLGAALGAAASLAL